MSGGDERGLPHVVTTGGVWFGGGGGGGSGSFTSTSMSAVCGGVPIDPEALARWRGFVYEGADCGFPTGMPVWATGSLRPAIECPGAHARLLALAGGAP